MYFLFFYTDLKSLSVSIKFTELILLEFLIFTFIKRVVISPAKFLYSLCFEIICFLSHLPSLLFYKLYDK